MKKILYYDRLSGIISIILCLLIPFVSNAASYKENKNNEENKYIIHRVTRILEDGTLRVKGDNEYRGYQWGLRNPFTG